MRLEGLFRKGERVLVMYSGGLDSSLAIHLARRMGLDPLPVLVDVGFPKTIVESAEANCRILGIELIMIDSRDRFLELAKIATLMNLDLEGNPLAPALSRIVIAEEISRIAEKEGINVILGGFSKRENDFERFSRLLSSLEEDLKLIPMDDLGALDRRRKIELGKRLGLSFYPIGEDWNYWGRFFGGALRELEDPERYLKIVEIPPREPARICVRFDGGLPTLDRGLAETIIERCGRAGFGFGSTFQKMLSGDGRMIFFEAPLAILMTRSHSNLEAAYLDREDLEEKRLLDYRFARIIYEGGFFSEETGRILDRAMEISKRVRGRLELEILGSTIRFHSVGDLDLRLFRYDRSDI